MKGGRRWVLGAAGREGLSVPRVGGAFCGRLEVVSRTKKQMKLMDLIPEADDFLALEPEELAGYLIEHLNSLPPNETEHFHKGNLSGKPALSGYSNKQEDCLRAFMEAWSVLEQEGLVAGQPGNTLGWQFITRRGRTLKNKEDFQKFRHSRLFPKTSIHPELLSKTYPLFLRGDYETAVFQAFKTVEVAVRDACPSEGDLLYGVPLMRRAFNAESGPLRDESEPIAEREALMHLFSGAIGRFKNPTSHRRVPLTSPEETIETLLFASHLLRIVDDRAD